MKFAMDGFRSHLSADVNYLKEMVEAVLNGDHYYKDDLRDAMNDVISHTNVLNCVYSTDDTNFTDMSGLTVGHIGQEDGQ